MPCDRQFWSQLVVSRRRRSCFWIAQTPSKATEAYLASMAGCASRQPRSSRLAREAGGNSQQDILHCFKPVCEITGGPQAEKLSCTSIYRAMPPSERKATDDRPYQAGPK